MDDSVKKVITNYKHNGWVIIAVICSIVSTVFFGLGFDRMFVYVNPTFSWQEGRNVHVGGDAYNLIINGTHATSFFVLGIGFLLAGLLMVFIYVHTNTQFAILKQNEQIIEALTYSNQSKTDETFDNSSDELPEL